MLGLTQNIVSSPYTSKAISELGDESIRERIVYSYRLIYRIKGDVITIAAVIHGKNLIEPFIERINE